MKREYIENEPLESPTFVALRKYVLDLRREGIGQGRSFEEYERELHELISSCEAELLAEDLARQDVEAPYIVVEGERYRRAIRAAQTYVGQAGEMRVERNLYQPVGGGASICPLELRAGIVEGAWTPRAARIMANVVADIPPTDAAGIIAEFGGMSPSASSLDRIPKLLSERWEERRLQWEEALRAQDRVPRDAASSKVIAGRTPGGSSPTPTRPRSASRTRAREGRRPDGHRNLEIRDGHPSTTIADGITSARATSCSSPSNRSPGLKAGFAAGNGSEDC